MLEVFKKYLLTAIATSSGLGNVLLFSIATESTEFEAPFRDISFWIPFQVVFGLVILA